MQEACVRLRNVVVSVRMLTALQAWHYLLWVYEYLSA